MLPYWPSVKFRGRLGFAVERRSPGAPSFCLETCAAVANWKSVESTGLCDLTARASAILCGHRLRFATRHVREVAAQSSFCLLLGSLHNRAKRTSTACPVPTAFRHEDAAFAVHFTFPIKRDCEGISWVDRINTAEG